jgi:hypothetical protein
MPVLLLLLLLLLLSLPSAAPPAPAPAPPALSPCTLSPLMTCAAISSLRPCSPMMRASMVDSAERDGGGGGGGSAEREVRLAGVLGVF